MILVWGLSGDGPLDAVLQSLRRLGAPYKFLDQRDVLDTVLEMKSGLAVTGTVRTPEETIHLDDVNSVYLRAYDSRRLADVAEAGEGSPPWSHAVAVESALYGWVELTSALVVNRPSAMTSNGSKPYQASIIHKHGFAVPETLVTTDASAVEDFRERHGSVIYKSISSVRSIASRLTPEQSERLEYLRWCPTQFQQYVPGTDYRVHVVGERLFACEIISGADDYRYAGRQGASIELRPCELPDDIGERAKVTAAAMGLLFAGVDLRRTPEGEWYCFEVNPSPGFTFYEPGGETAIADAVASLLAENR